VNEIPKGFEGLAEFEEGSLITSQLGALLRGDLELLEYC
jgi:hypothetical protein